jgi:NAD(P)-dependent dehydrogenase (short-subunit alcohol dehydrogenase family)
MVGTAKSELGAIDILINNAGIAITRGIDDLSEADFDQTIAINLKSVFLCTLAVLPMMRAKNWGRIVNISLLHPPVSKLQPALFRRNRPLASSRNVDGRDRCCGP